TIADSTPLRLHLAPKAVLDFFQNPLEAAYDRDLVWSATGSALIEDTAPPQLDLVRVHENVLTVGFTETIDAAQATTAITVDGNPVTWTAEEDGYGLRTDPPLANGQHRIEIAASLEDLAGTSLGTGFARTVEITPAGALVYVRPDPREISNTAASNPYGFQGLPRDPETGFLYARNRYYDPEIGRFISTDPLGYVDGPSMYGFAGNDPINESDPLGLSVWRKLWNARKLPKRFKHAERLTATADLWSKVKRSDVVGVAEDGRAMVSGRKVVLPVGAKPGETYRYASRTGAQYDVPISSEGWVDFSSYAKHELKDFQMSGDSALDVARAKEMYKSATGMDTPSGFTWHHSPDAKTMQLVPSDLNAMHHTGGDAITRAAIEKVADEGGLATRAGTAVATAGVALGQLFTPNSMKAEGVVDTAVSVAVDALDFLDPGVQDIYMGLMWVTNKATGLDIEVETLEDVHDEWLAPNKK
ncbi:MAG: HNH endonuclease, partial [Thermoanaerobaculia bacterium]|nr:HNH endonuclease [Thermoanaerobaculia bacterium]